MGYLRQRPSAHRSFAAADILARVSGLFGWRNPRSCDAFSEGVFSAHAALLEVDILDRVPASRSARCLFSAIKGSELSFLCVLNKGPLGSSARTRSWALRDSDKLGCRPSFATRIFSRNSGVAHKALSFSRTSGRLAGLFSPMKRLADSRKFASIFSRVSGFRIGLFRSMCSLREAFPDADIPPVPSPPARKLESGPVPVCMRPKSAINFLSRAIPCSMDSTV